MRVVPFAALAPFAVGLLFASPPAALAQESQLATLRAASKAAPGDPETILALGRALRIAGHIAEATTMLHAARTLAVAPAAVSRADWELERLQSDRHDFFGATAVCNDFGTPLKVTPEGHACLAAAQLVRQRATEALTETQLALAADPRSFEAKLAEGRAYSLQLDGARAEASLRAAIALRPAATEPFVDLGRVLEREGKNDDALAALRAAIQLDPHGPDALFALATIVPAGLEKIDLLRRATVERPSFLDAWVALGAAQFDLGHAVEAKSAATSALAVDAASAPARVLLGRVALLDGRFDDAIEAGRAALKVMSNSAAATLLIADGQAHKGEVDLALEAYQSAWGLDHGDPTPLVHASEACHAAGRDTSARAFGIKATQEFPKWGPGWVALGDALVGQGERAAARDAYRKALASDGLPNPPSVQAKLAALQ